MATVRITHRWADGSTTQVSVKVADSFPDVISEAKANAVAAMRDVLGIFEAEDAEG